MTAMDLTKTADTWNKFSISVDKVASLFSDRLKGVINPFIMLNLELGGEQV